MFDDDLRPSSGFGRQVSFTVSKVSFGARRSKVVKKALMLAVVSVVALIPFSGASAQSFFNELNYEVDAGLSMPTGDASDFYNMGFVLGGTAFYPYSDRIHLGMRLAYNRWGIDGGGWLGSNVDGSASMMEFVPQIKYLFPTSETSAMGFFAQGGLGFYRYGYNVDVSYNGIDLSYDDSSFNLGICLGGGVTLDRGGRKWFVRPMYHIVFTEGDSSKYLTLSFGLEF
jgi:hypothetical protein